MAERTPAIWPVSAALSSTTPAGLNLFLRPVMIDETLSFHSMNSPFPPTEG